MKCTRYTAEELDARGRALNTILHADAGADIGRIRVDRAVHYIVVTTRGNVIPESSDVAYNTYGHLTWDVLQLNGNIFTLMTVPSNLR